MSGSVLGAFREPPGSLLGASWAPLGAGASREPPGSLLAASWEHPGSMLGVSWELPGSGNLLGASCELSLSGSLLGASSWALNFSFYRFAFALFILFWKFQILRVLVCLFFSL